MFKKSKRVVKRSLPKVEKDSIKRTKIKVIGIGGGGSFIVSEIASGRVSSKMEKASFVVANTDLQALRLASRKAQRFHFGQNLTQGLGTGMSVELGEMAAQNEKEKIKKILEGQDLCIIVACLGGGTSSGATPIFAKVSRKLGNITLGIFTLPFKFEGEKKMEIAKAALEKLKPKFNAIIIIPNERIFQIIDKKTPLKVALSAINKNLAESLGGLIETIYQPGLINIDFADLKTILGGQGRLAYLNTIEVQKKGDSTKIAVEKVLNSPLYPYSIRGAKGVLLNIAGERDLELSEVNQISKIISGLSNKEAKIIFGVSQNKKYSNIIKITLLATGCATKIFSSKSKKRKSKKKKIIKKASIPKKTPQLFKSKTKLAKKSLKENRLPARQAKKSKKSKPRQGSTSPAIASPRGKKRGKQGSSGAAKKVKIKVQKELKEKGILQPKVEEKEATPVSNEKVELRSLLLPEKKELYRKNALQIKKEAEEAEEEMLEKENLWEIPAFLRHQKKKS